MVRDIYLDLLGSDTMKLITEIPEDLNQALNQYANRYDISKASVVRIALNKLFDDDEKVTART